MKKSYLATLILMFCSSLNAQQTYEAQAKAYSQTNHGGVGLIQMPTARMNETGAFSLNYQDSQEYRFWSASVQLFSWMEATVRYSDFRTVLYSDDPSFSGDQTLKDKGIDAKFKLWKESEFLPDVTLGFRDFGGTGLFESEFLAASKRIGAFDLHLGMGWGYLGRKDNISNPFCDLNDSFCERPTAFSGSGGKIDYQRFFKGPASLYGGIEYHTPWQPLTLKIEYDGNDYKSDYAGVLETNSDFNFGALYRVSDSFIVNLNYQRGNTFGFGVNYVIDFNDIKQVKFDPPAKDIPKVLPKAEDSIDKAQMNRELYLNAGFMVSNFAIKADEIVVSGVQIAYRDEDVAMDRIGRVLANHLPPTIKTYRIVAVEAGLPQVETVINAERFVSEARYESLSADVKNSYVRTEPKVDNEPWAIPRDHSGFGYNADVFWIQTFGSPEKFYMYQGGLMLGGAYQFNNNFSFQTTAKVNLLTNFDDFNFKVDNLQTNVPRVRTYIREYVTRSDITMENLYGHWKDKVADNWYGQFYAGYLETMFAGVGGEFLYKPIDSSLAVGVDLNYVRQRDYDSDTALFDYKTLTGHLSFYWKPFFLDDSMVTASVGQYLAKDKGVTLDFSKRFESGIIVGAYAAITDMSSEEYGEGSFTKGFYVSIPFDLFSLKSATGRGRIPWIPIARDGGQMLNKPASLNAITEARSPFMR